MSGARVIGLGSNLPTKIVTNDDLANTLDTSDEWIKERTGIHQRHVDGSTTEMAVAAGAEAINQAGVDPSSIGLLVLATSTADQTFPAAAVSVQYRLGVAGGAMDLNAACAGFTHAYIMTAGFMASPGAPERALVIGSDAMSRIVNWDDRGTAILFGDGAGAAVLERTAEPHMLGWDMGADGSLYDILHCPAGGTIEMDGREVFRKAVRAVVQSIEKSCKIASISPTDIDLLVPHQANVRIIQAVCSRLEIPIDRAINVIDETANTSAGSVPIALTAAERDGRLQPGSKVCLTGFGAGMSWASVVLKW